MKAFLAGLNIRLTNPMKKPSPPKSKTQIPARYHQFVKSYPTVMQAVEALGEVTQSAGPLDSKTRALVKLAIAVGALREGAVHSHTRRALEAGCTPEELRHVGVLAITTIGFPSTMAAMSWVEDILRK
jgi:alkylhydroperoxidase/carboxymuconolactone decarboxylase family protein YurZ